MMTSPSSEIVQEYEKEIEELRVREKKLMNLLKRLVTHADTSHRGFREELLALEAEESRSTSRHPTPV